MAATIGLKTLVRQKPDALWSAVGDEVVLMNLERGKYYGLGEIGSDIWRRVSCPVSVGDLAAALSLEYSGDPDVIERDTMVLLEQLAQRNLLECQ